MPSSKTDTAIRYPERADQQRRIRGVTQDRKWEARMRDKAASNPEMPSNATAWGPESTLELHMDQAGNPQPDPSQFSDGNRAARQGLEGAGL
ncbi:conserved hypothetical protein [Talaromyces stipitatus ATCC 10500]|uniref:Uncharacterized protein n=1 Tax=Talaromyces stipitatus (strain ATCC 10500 / CBS 375.48 / QM 6759 / NRRL 1006) TaxID=441959 RepID=B8MQ61_TALSN|nr:uncharacterized protein TSTA_055870 [Talaromyces stipitatus ATCC 10500]EED13087.1 conserved hypothetical protein [Talaromyces stipitatus ATCC 10500]